MMVAVATSHWSTALPWELDAADEARFRRIWRSVLLIVAVTALCLASWPVVRRAPMMAPALPSMPMATVLPPEPVTTPSAPSAPLAPLAPLAPSIKPNAPSATASERNERSAAEESRPKSSANKTAISPSASTDAQPVDRVAQAQQRAAAAGVLALKDQLADLRGVVSSNSSALTRAVPPPGSGGTVNTRTDSSAPLSAGEIVAARSGGMTSGGAGVNTAGLSRETGGQALADRATTVVQASNGNGTADAEDSADSANKNAASRKAARSIEDIKLVFERNKGSIYALYQRALREDPSLQGKLVLELKIAPSGQVMNLRLLSSDLNAPELEKKLLARIKQFDFGAKNVDVLTLTWPVDFLPS